MTALENFVSPVLMRALGWTLLHSLWQGVLVAGVLAGALLLLRRQRAEVRYIASAGALGAVVALAGITFGLYFNSGTRQGVLPSAAVANATMVSAPNQPARPTRPAAAAGELPLSGSATEAAAANGPRSLPTLAVAALPASISPAPRAAWLTAGLRYFDNHLPLVVVAWLLGLLAMSLRMVGGLLYVQRLRHRRARPLGAVWQARLTALAGRGGVRRPVALLESALVRVPLVVGHWRPVILLPLGMVAGLSPASLEAILAHEIAHVMRRDYLVNLLQTVAEALFFYHPAVWFVASCVRAERENCCDDAATALCGGDSLRLARALTDLAEWSQSAVVPAHPRLALAAMGGRGALLGRVRRLVQRRPAAPTLAEGLLAGALVLGGLGLLGSGVALAGPLTQPAQPAAFDWQAGSAHALPGSGSLNGQREAPRTAENALREADAVKNLSLDQRTVDELRERQEVLRDREQELRARRAALQERIRASQQERQDLEETRPGQDPDQRQAALDRAQASRDQESAELDQERASRNQERAERNRKQNEALVAQLMKDGLVQDQNNYQVKLSASSMVVDGKIQPPAVFRSYLKLYESTTGRKMSATGSWAMTRNSTSNTNTNTFRNGNDVPRPPRPPRGPAAPPAPTGAPATAAPAPPRPPRAPGIDTRALRDELRKDGLIGQSDKHFRLQLNDAGLTVNGKRQPDELAAKYRTLMGHDGPGQVHTLSVSGDD